MSIVEIHVIFKGNVQGVGFRSTAVILAERLNLVGFVRNRNEGDVELCAQGEKTDLELLVRKLEEKFNRYGALSCDLKWREIKKKYSRFTIEY
jgi:acylphosphatase